MKKPTRLNGFPLSQWEIATLIAALQLWRDHDHAGTPHMLSEAAVQKINNLINKVEAN